MTGSASEIADAVRAGTTRARHVIERTLQRIDTLDARLNAFTDVTVERALEEADGVDRAVARGQPVGPLAGVPFAVKNLFDVTGRPTLAGSKINRDDPPANTDATLIHRLNRAGAVLVGTLNMGEYAYDFTGENAHYGPSRNPHDPDHMSGGSSGGSGTAVGAALVPIALGSDTNGSIRVPSSLCGTFGLKPTFGRLSRAGVFPFCASLDHVGPLARTVADLALAYDVMQGPDARDPVCSTDIAPQPTTALLSEGIDGLRIAVAGGYFRRNGILQSLEAVDRVASALGADNTVELPEVERARAAAYLITNAESSNLHLQYLRERPADYDPDVRDRLLAGTLLPAAWYLQAQRFRSWYRRRVAEIFQRFDVLLAPATPIAAPRIGQRYMTLDGENMMVRPHLGLYTQPLSFIGLPVAVVPVHTPGALPIGVQVVAAPWQEATVLRVASWLEHHGFSAPPANIEQQRG